tara:strand:+ start:36698 stop:37348 length:651 start_codon:yes stop_codon:yes gene_type:complete
MKAKYFIILFCVISLNSCVLKSLHPFYITSAISFQESFLGKWEDSKKGKWEVLSLKEVYQKEKEKEPETQEDEEFYKEYKESYFIEYIENNKEATFVGVPFKVNNQLFIDFSVWSYNQIGLNELAASSLLGTHTLARLEVLENGKIQLKWFDSDQIKALFSKNQIRIKHEEVGVNKSLFLTASSNELYKFLKKYTLSEIENKWTTDVEYTLTRTNE